jgi:hypothetical protein
MDFVQSITRFQLAVIINIGENPLENDIDQ